MGGLSQKLLIGRFNCEEKWHSIRGGPVDPSGSIKEAPPLLPSGRGKARPLPLAWHSASIKDNPIGAEHVSPQVNFHKWWSQNLQHPPLPSVPERTLGLECPAGHTCQGDWGGLNLLLPAQLSVGNFRCPFFLTCILTFSSLNLQVGFGNVFPPHE